jgi:segregation and condensation protein B
MSIVDQLEALLFVSDAPVSVDALAVAINATEGQIEQGLEILEARLEEKGALQLNKIAGGFQLSTKPQHAEMVANYLKPQRQKLSRSLMEVLAIVAYRQPITVTEIEIVRGVQSDYSIKALQERRLIEEIGRKPVPGRPVLYATTDQFLHQFNLNDLSQLPPIEIDGSRALAIVSSTLPIEANNLPL